LRLLSPYWTKTQICILATLYMTPELVLLTRLFDSLFGWQLTKMSGHPIFLFGTSEAQKS